MSYIWVLLNPPTTDQQTTDHLPTDPTTHQPPTYWRTDTIIIFKILEYSKIFTLQNTNSRVNVKRYFGLLRSFRKRQKSGTWSDNEWQRVVQRVTTNGNEWRVVQRVTASGTTSDKKWQWVIQRVTTKSNEWQWVTAVVQPVKRKRHSTLQRMDDCHTFNDKNRYTTTSRDRWLQLEWLNR